MEQNPCLYFLLLLRQDNLVYFRYLYGRFFQGNCDFLVYFLYLWIFLVHIKIMGRHRREYPLGKLRLKYPKQNYDKQKAYTLYYEYTWLDDAPIRRDTGLRVRVADWNEKGTSGRGELRPSYGTDYRRQNTNLADALSKYDSTLQQYSLKHPHQITSEVIRSILFDAPLTRRDEGRDFVEYVLTNLNSRLVKNKIGKSRYENGVSGMKIFREFLQSQNEGTYRPDSIYLGEISTDLIDRYIEYRRKIKGNTDATINHSLTPIIQACEKARDEGLIDTKLYSGIKDSRVVETPNLEEENFDGKEKLTKDEIQRLVEFYNTDTETRRKEYIEMFLFAFHAGGMRPIDVMTLMWSSVNMEKRELRKILIKTAKGKNPRHTIPLNDAAISILTKWKERGRRQKFVFDILDDSFDINDENALYYARNTGERKINQSLAVVGEKIGLNIRLTFKVARHTFATLALSDGMSISVVSRLLGHSSTDTTESYYAEYLPHKLDEELNKLGYDFVPDLK